MSNRAPNVYVVEDDEANRKSLTDLLETYGYCVAAFANGEDFLKHADLSSEPTLVLDVNLPGASGLEVLEQLRMQRITVPAVVVSGRATSQMRARAEQLGAVAFLEKPIEIDRLVSILDLGLKQS